jgi:hypothetical protein
MLRDKIMPLSMTEMIESSICELLMQDD